MKRKEIKRETYNIDATGKSLGRLATQITTLLRGKNKTNFLPYLDQGSFVEVINADRIKITGKKLENKIYFRYTGYPGGIRETILKDIFKKNPAEALKRAVYRMLPKNKLRKEMIKRLIIK